MFEASKIDGASPFQTFKNVTVPLLAPSIFFVVIITAISSFQVFDLIYLMTQGGPLDSTNVLVYAIYKNAFEYFRAGITVKPKIKRKKTLFKYTCPECKQIAKGKKDIAIKCGNCDVVMEMEEVEDEDESDNN